MAAPHRYKKPADIKLHALFSGGCFSYDTDVFRYERVGPSPMLGQHNDNDRTWWYVYCTDRRDLSVREAYVWQIWRPVVPGQPGWLWHWADFGSFTGFKGVEQELLRWLGVAGPVPANSAKRFILSRRQIDMGTVEAVRDAWARQNGWIA